MTLDLSIVICTHNRYELLLEAITSVEVQDLSPSRYELIVVDNSTELALQKDFWDATDISCPHQIILEPVPGLSRARNIGVMAAKGRFVAFMDDDARAPVNWARETVGVFDRHELAGVVGGPVRPIWPVPRPPWLHKWLEGFLTIVDRGETERVLDAKEWVAGTNIAFHRERLIAAGLFEERLGRIGKLLLSNEELLVTNKLKSAGYSTVYNPNMAMNHIVHADRINQAWFRKRIFWQVVSDLFTSNDEGTPFEDRVSKILDYQTKLTPKNRGLPGLFADTESADLFYAQMEALSNLVRLMADDGRDWRAFLQVGEP